MCIRDRRRPSNGRTSYLGSSRAVQSAILFTQVPNLPAKARLEGGSEVAQSSNPQAAQAFAFGAREPGRLKHTNLRQAVEA
eukprot:14637834-Alexandrium_andersonii.AAC.1